MKVFTRIGEKGEKGQNASPERRASKREAVGKMVRQFSVLLMSLCRSLRQPVLLATTTSDRP